MAEEYTYKVFLEGVLRSDGTYLQPNDKNLEWKNYQKWLDEGNTPGPEFTQDEIEENSRFREAEALNVGLRQTDHWLFRMILEVWAVGVQKGLWSNTDISNEDLKAKVQTWKTKLDRLEELGE